MSLARLFLVCALLTVGYVSTGSLDEEVTLTMKEKEILYKFKLLVAPYLYQDYMKEEIYLVRWLRAKNFNLKEAKKMLMENIQWRKDNKIDSIISEDFSDIDADAPYRILGQAKDKSPVAYWEVAEMDLRKLYLTRKLPRLLRFMDKFLEEITIMTRSLENQNVTQFDFIINLEGLNLPQHGCVGCLPGMMNFFLSYENHYPGTVNRMITINGNSVMDVIFQPIKLGMSQRTLKALEAYGTNKNIWVNRLLEFVDKDVLPIQLGGNAFLEFD